MCLVTLKNLKTTVMGKKIFLLIFLSLSISVVLKAQQTELSIQTGHVAAINKIVFSTDGNFLASSDDQNKICIWDMSGLTQMASFFYSDLDTNDRISLLAFSLDNKKLIAGTLSGNILVLDIGKSEKIRGFPTGKKITKLLFINNSTCLILSSSLLSLNLNNYSISEIYNGDVADLYFNKNNNELIFCTFSGDIGKITQQDGIRIQLTDTNMNNLKKRLSNKYSGIARIKLTDKIIVASNFYNLRFYDFASKRKVYSASMPYMDERITDIEYLPQNNYFIVSNTDGKIYVYDCHKSKLVKILKLHISEVNSLAVHPTKNLFASGSSDRSIILWDAITLKPIKRFYSRASSI